MSEISNLIMLIRIGSRNLGSLGGLAGPFNSEVLAVNVVHFDLTMSAVSEDYAVPFFLMASNLSCI